MSKMQRDKGARGDLHVAAMLCRVGFDAKRQPQSNGEINSDVVLRDHPNIYIEAKFEADFKAHTAKANGYVLTAVQQASEARKTHACVIAAIPRTRPKAWAMGFVNDYGVVVWTHGPERIARVLQEWV